MDLQVSLDANEFSALIAEANGLLEHPTDQTREIVKLFLDRLNTGSQFGSVNINHSPANTSELRALLQPSDTFRQFVAALRAGSSSTSV